MRLAGIAGALVMLVPCLVGCGGSDETPPEQNVIPLDILACETTVQGARGGRYLVVRTARGTFAVHREGTIPRG
jgi:hypothetical protein